MELRFTSAGNNDSRTYNDILSWNSKWNIYCYTNRKGY